MELSLIRGIVPPTVFGVTAVAALVLLIGLVVGGLIYLAFPILIVVGIVGLLL